MQHKILPFAVLGLASILSACAFNPVYTKAPAESEVQLPVEELDRLIAEYRNRSLDNPTVENLTHLNRLLTMRQKNLARQAAEKQGKNPATKEAIASNKYRQVTRDHSMDWDHDGRGGAAMRQPAYVHTLSGYSTTHKPTEVSPNFGMTRPINAHPVMLENAIKVGISFGDPTKPQSYSIYEMSRWERFCKDEGKAMDKRDWDFVKKEGANNLPEHLRATCNPPKRVL